MHARAWVAQGACKFYWYLKNFKVIRNPLQKPEIWTCFCLGLVGLAQGKWKETSNGSTVIDDCAFANWNPGVKDFSWFCTKPGYMTEVHFILAVSTVLQEPLCKSSDWDKVNASTMVPLLKPEKGVLRANGKLNNIEPINKHPMMKGTRSNAASSYLD
jgi:hypothetical protein